MGRCDLVNLSTFVRAFPNTLFFLIMMSEQHDAYEVARTTIDKEVVTASATWWGSITHLFFLLFSGAFTFQKGQKLQLWQQFVASEVLILRPNCVALAS